MSVEISSVIIDDKYKHHLKSTTNDSNLKCPDFSKPFNFTIDVRNFAIGKVPSQDPKENDNAICYGNRTLQQQKSIIRQLRKHS